MVLVVLADRVELRGHPADPMVPLSGELVASARPAGDGWAVRWQDGREDQLRDRDAVQDLLRDRDAVQDLLIGHMRR